MKSDNKAKEREATKNANDLKRATEKVASLEEKVAALKVDFKQKEAEREAAAKAAAEAKLSAAMEGTDADALERVVRELHELQIVPVEQLRAAALRHAELAAVSVE